MTGVQTCALPISEKKTAFDKMLLALPPLVKDIWHQLPGGMILQNYVEELEEKSGLPIDIDASLETNTTDSNDKILATALAANNDAKENNTPKFVPQMNISPNIVADNVKMSLDKNFATDFAQALSSALQQSSQKQENNIKELISSIGKSQESLFNILQHNNNENQNNLKKIAEVIMQKTK